MEDNIKTPVCPAKLGINDNSIDIVTNRSKAENKNPPIIVKSHFVCIANVVNATTTIVVTSTASVTCIFQF